MRVFPVSLQDLCELFGVKGKLSKYNIEFNDLSLFFNKELLNQFKEYSIQDYLALYETLKTAQQIYLRDYNVDITSILSTSSLSLKIFRQIFLDTDIPVLKGTEDSFIRRGYFGGHTDYYKSYITKGKYYDINSLYPKAMCQPMPHKIIKKYNDMSHIKLNDFFGFALAEITTPKNILKPLLPYKHEGKTIYPTGSFIGVYFSEELKKIQSKGYQMKLIKGYEFSKISLFDKYVEHFYNKKKTAKGASRFIAKMHLNQLYGVFGRKQETLETINIYNKDLIKYLTTRIVKAVIHINEDISTILMLSNINSDILNELNSSLDTNLYNHRSEVKSNVALAAAVSAYGRIHMIDYILNNEVAYIDTDSVFTTHLLDESLIGKDLGLMKDELEGNIIEEAYFLGIKQYGYHYNDSVSQSNIMKSVFAGVPRDCLNFKEVTSIFEGEIITKNVPSRFYKCLKDLNISIKDIKIDISKNNDKILLNNDYIPMNIYNLNHELDNRSFFLKLKNRFILLIKRYFK